MDKIEGKFARVKSEAYEEYGVDKGATVLIAGSGFAPVDDDDNYKLLFIVVPIVDGRPTMDKGVTMARKSLEILSDKRCATLQAQMEKVGAKEQEKAASH